MQYLTYLLVFSNNYQNTSRPYFQIVQNPTRTRFTRQRPNGSGRVGSGRFSPEMKTNPSYHPLNFPNQYNHIRKGVIKPFLIFHPWFQESRKIFQNPNSIPLAHVVFLLPIPLKT